MFDITKDVIDPDDLLTIIGILQDRSPFFLVDLLGVTQEQARAMLNSALQWREYKHHGMKHDRG